MIDYNRALLIAVFSKVIDFTNKMDKGLINPNQCRYFCVQYFGNPTYITSKLGFYDNDVCPSIFHAGN